MLIQARAHWQSLYGLASRLTNAWSAISARQDDLAPLTKFVFGAQPKPKADLAPKPSLAAVMLDEAEIKQALCGGVDIATDLRPWLASLFDCLRRAVVNPVPLYRAFLANLRKPLGGANAQPGSLFTDPDAYGGSRRRKGLFVPEPKKEERAQAIKAVSAR